MNWCFSDKISKGVAEEKPATNPNQPQKLKDMTEAEQKPNGNWKPKVYFGKLPDGIEENILFLVTTTARQTLETYCSLVQTCKIFSNIPE